MEELEAQEKDMRVIEFLFKNSDFLKHIQKANYSPKVIDPYISAKWDGEALIAVAERVRV